jgi:hypothetical protein
VLAAATSYKVTFKLPRGGEQSVQVPDDQYILDAGAWLNEQNGLNAASGPAADRRRSLRPSSSLQNELPAFVYQHFASPVVLHY